MSHMLPKPGVSFDSLPSMAATRINASAERPALVINVHKVPGGQVHKCESYTETKPVVINIEIENFFSTFPLLSHEHPKWGFPGHRDGKRWNNPWPRKVYWCHHLTVQPCTSLCFVLFCFNSWNFRGLMGFHSNLETTPRNTKAVARRVSRENEEEKKKKKYSSMCLSWTTDWLVNIFKWRFFSYHFWYCLLNFTMKTEVTKENVLQRGEDDLFPS